MKLLRPCILIVLCLTITFPALGKRASHKAKDYYITASLSCSGLADVSGTVTFNVSLNNGGMVHSESLSCSVANQGGSTITFPYYDNEYLWTATVDVYSPEELQKNCV